MSKKLLPLFLIIFFFLTVAIFLSYRKPPVKPTPESPYPTNVKSPQTDWSTFTDELENISFKYPKNWQFRPDSQNFEAGDLFAIAIEGQTQKPQTEYYDGASFAVMQPVDSDLDALSWAHERYKNKPDEEFDPEFLEETFAQKLYQKVYICTLGCISYYHIRENGKIYGFAYVSAGPDKAVFDADFRQIMESVNFNPLHPPD